MALFPHLQIHVINNGMFRFLFRENIFGNNYLRLAVSVRVGAETVARDLHGAGTILRHPLRVMKNIVL